MGIYSKEKFFNNRSRGRTATKSPKPPTKNLINALRLILLFKEVYTTAYRVNLIFLIVFNNIYYSKGFTTRYINSPDLTNIPKLYYYIYRVLIILYKGID